MLAPIFQPPPPPLSPGALLWGRGAGCSFVNNHPRTWPGRYHCSQQQEYGCTPDNRMSSGGSIGDPHGFITLLHPTCASVVCAIDASYASETTCASWGGFSETQGPQCTMVNDACSGGSCEIASKLRFFTSDSAASAAAGRQIAATAARTGGFSAALDYVPTQLGYWSCQAQTPNTNLTGGGSGESSQLLAKSLTSIFGSVHDMATFGGQARCPLCRCLVSSLIQISM